MISLVESLRTWGRLIEADFRNEYALSLWEMAAIGDWARIQRLIVTLSESSRYVTAVALTSDAAPSKKKPDIQEWARTDRLLASVIDELAIANWQRAPKSKKPSLLTERPKHTRRKNDLSHFEQDDIRAALLAVGPQSESE